MFDGAYMSKEVIAAVVQLLPVFLIALIVGTGASMSRWIHVDRMSRSQHRLAKRTSRGFVVLVAWAMLIEVYFLFSLNDGDAHGLHAFALWAVSLVWLLLLALGVLIETVPDLKRSSPEDSTTTK